MVAGRCERLRGVQKPGGARRGPRSLKREEKTVWSFHAGLDPDNHATFVPRNLSQSALEVPEMTRVLREHIPLSKGSGSIEAAAKS